MKINTRIFKSDLKEKEKLMEEFNKEAKNINSKYYMIIDASEDLKLKKGKFFVVIDEIIDYNHYSNIFTIYGGLDEDVFNEIKEILEKLDLEQTFEIEVLK